MAVVDILKSLRMRCCMDATNPAAACPPGNTATAAGLGFDPRHGRLRRAFRRRLRRNTLGAATAGEGAGHCFWGGNRDRSRG
jgi:hypothetical protein